MVIRSQIVLWPSRSTSLKEGEGSMDRSAGIKVSSRIKELTIPAPVRIPKVRIDLSSKTTSEKNPRAATVQASTITGPTFDSEFKTATWLRSFGERLGCSFETLEYSS